MYSSVCAPIVVRVLGPVDVAGLERPGPAHRYETRLTELAALLALHPAGLSAEAVTAAMTGMAGSWATPTRQAAMCRLRAWMGPTATTGQLRVPILSTGARYRLHPDVGTDWDTFRALVRPGADPDRLAQALGLVRGQPFAGVPYGRYLWADLIRAEAITAIEDTAHALAVHHTVAGDIPAARRAVAVGLTAEPGSDRLYRALLRAEHRARNRAGVLAAADRIAAINLGLGTEPESETTQLIEALLSHLGPIDRFL